MIAGIGLFILFSFGFALFVARIMGKLARQDSEVDVYLAQAMQTEN